MDNTDAVQAQRPDVYATLNFAMDHLLAGFSSADDVAPLPSSLLLRHREKTLLDTWSELQACVANRCEVIAHRKQQRDEKRKAKQASAEAKVPKAERAASSSSATIMRESSPRSSSSTVAKSKKPKSDSSRASAEPLGTSRKTSKAAKLSPRASEPTNLQHTAVATKSTKSVSPHISHTTAKKEKPSWGPISAGPAKQQVTSSALTRLRKLPMLRDLEADTLKYNVLIKWLDCDQGKNAPLSRDLAAQLTAFERRVAFSGSSASRKSAAAPASVPVATTPASKQKLKTHETLDERLRKEKDAVRAERRRASHKRKRAAGSDDDDDGGGDDDDEPEYADGYSDSDEAEATLTLNDPAAPKLRTRDITGGTKRYATSQRAAASPPVPVVGSAKDQLQHVVTRLKEEDGVTAGSEATAAGGMSPGASAQSAIVLEDSEVEEDEDDEEEEEKASPPLPQKQAVPAKKPVAASKRAAKAPAAQDGDGDDGDESAADYSSTDDDEDLFDLNEEDVYVVESILEVKIGRTLPSKSTSGARSMTKEMDLYLVKWDGYDELTWEPETNIPKRLLELFRQRELTKRANRYKITTFLQRKVVKNVTTASSETIYLIHWVGEDAPIWECRSNLPEQVVIWLEKTSRAKGHAHSSNLGIAGKKKARA